MVCNNLRKNKRKNMKKILLCCALLTGVIGVNFLSSCSCSSQNVENDKNDNKDDKKDDNKDDKKDDPSNGATKPGDKVDCPECFG